MDGKAVNLDSEPDLGFPTHAACNGDYASTVRKLENDFEENRAASRTYDGTDCMYGRRSCCEQSANRYKLLRQPLGDERAISARRQRALRATNPAALHAELISGAAQAVAQTPQFLPGAAFAASGFSCSAQTISRKGIA